MVKSYIVLKGSDAVLSADNNYLRWNLERDYFNNSNDKKIYMSLIQTNFIGKYTTTHATSTMYLAPVYCDLGFYNQKKSSGRSLLSLCRILDDDTNKNISSFEHNNNHMQLFVGETPPSSIEISVQYYDELISFATVANNIDKDNFSFVFEINYYV